MDPVSVNLGLGFLAILVLDFLRRRLIFEWLSLSLIVVGTPKLGHVFYTLLFLPGTIIHELSHWLVAELLRVPTGEISIFPEIDQKSGETRLGSVQVGSADPIRNFLIGLAPMLTGLALLVVFSVLLADTTISSSLARAGLLYGIIVVGNSMLLSRSDRAFWPIVIFLIPITIASLQYFGVRFSAAAIESVVGISSVLTSSLILAIALNTGLFILALFLRKFAENITGRRIAKR